MPRILHKFKMNEISSVDRPAQKGAKMVLMKRDSLELAKGAFVDALQELRLENTVREALDGLWETQAALREAVTEIVECPEEYPDQQAAITQALAEFSAEVRAMVAAAAKPISDVADGGEPPSDDGTSKRETQSPEEGMMKTQEELTTELELVTKQLAKAESYGRLTDIEKAHFNSLPTIDQDLFIKMDTGARANALEKAAASNPVVYTTSDGTEFRKNDDPRLISMAKQADENLKVAKAAQDKADTMEFEKRANDELGNLPGDKAAKIALLKAINGITDETIRTGVSQLIKAGNDGLAAAFNTHGTMTPADGSAEHQLDSLAKAYAAANNVTFAKAYDEVLKTDEGAALYAKL